VTSALTAVTPRLDLHPSIWFVTIGIAVAVLAFDVYWIARNPHRPSTKEVALALSVYVSAAILFGIWLWSYAGAQLAGEYFAGWLTEYSLSVDNLFIFLLIMAKFAVPERLQQFALMVGIVLALIFRGIFIAVGAAAIERFSWVFFIFGAFLIYTAVKLYLDYRAKHSEDDDDVENALMRWVKKVFPATEDYRGTKLTVVEGGKRLITPMLIVIVALGSTDLLFALDSIPAIFGLTREPYLVFTANVFALMGLRQLYFLIGGLLQRLVYLSVGLSVILAFIGVKLVLHAMHEYHLDTPLGIDGEIPIWVSLTVIIATLLVTTVASLIKSGRDARAAS
jgi:tellurite resistance protein TerC